MPDNDADPVRIAGTFRGGVVDLTGLRATHYMVRVHATGSSHWPSDWIPLDAAKAPVPMVINLVPTIARKVIVFTEEGRPVVGGRVALADGVRLTRGRRGWEWQAPTMTARQPDQRHRPVSHLADRATTDPSGAVTLRCIERDGPVYLVVEGGGAQTVVRDLPDWTAGRAPLLVTVPGGCEWSGTITPVDFVTALDCSTEQEQERAARCGVTSNPWGQSQADLHAKCRPCIVLRRAGGHANNEPQPSCRGVIAEDGSFRLTGVPPGRYEAVVVVRWRGDGGIEEEIIEPRLGELEVRAGESTSVTYPTPETLAARAAEGHGHREPERISSRGPRLLLELPDTG